MRLIISGHEDFVARPGEGLPHQEVLAEGFASQRARAREDGVPSGTHLPLLCHQGCKDMTMSA